MKPTVVKQIRQYHGQVVKADKSIAAVGKAQIRAAYKCGQLLKKARGRSGNWKRFCAKCGMSDDTAGRYINLSKSAGLRTLLSKYRTLNAAYVGEGITSAPRQRITITPVNSAPSDSGVKPTVTHNGGGESSVSVNGNDNLERRPSDILIAKRYANKLCQLLDTTEDKQAMIDAIQNLIDEISEYVRLKAERERRIAEDAKFDKAALAA